MICAFGLVMGACKPATPTVIDAPLTVSQAATPDSPAAVITPTIGQLVQLPERTFSAVEPTGDSIGVITPTPFDWPSKTPDSSEVTLVGSAPSLTPTPLVLRVVVAPSTVVMATPNFSALVSPGGGGLRLRSEPDTDSAILSYLREETPLRITGRTTDSSWLQVITGEGSSGWVVTDYVNVNSDIEVIPVSSAVFTAPVPPPPAGMRNVVSGISGNARDIFLRGQALGNRADVFSKVGDSITVATYFLYPFGWQGSNLRDYGYLGPTLQYFSNTTARDGSSFTNTSVAAGNGWTTGYVLDPRHAPPQFCANESPLACEYRLVRPSVALIMFGTNDAANLTSADFGANLSQIVEITINSGVVPVLSTIPPRPGWERQIEQFNAIIINTARDYDIPLWDYNSAMRTLPNSGLSNDGVHPSWPPGDTIEAANLTAANLRFGYTMRNLTALQVLDALRRQVLR
ncbi:MAG: SGNH/GDSL hydrolase family protein [Burkholderiales bacterium]|nr:SGNH/GDSL hydrolase family protein [Anaerolineae bacterium]